MNDLKLPQEFTLWLEKYETKRTTPFEPHVETYLKSILHSHDIIPLCNFDQVSTFWGIMNHLSNLPNLKPSYSIWFTRDSHLPVNCQYCVVYSVKREDYKEEYLLDPVLKLIGNCKYILGVNVSSRQYTLVFTIWCTRGGQNKVQEMFPEVKMILT